jgi:sugar phosphate isomerase/epimerase
VNRKGGAKKMNVPFFKPCISEATTMPSSFAEDVASFADAGCQGMEVWLTKLETHLETHSLDETRKLLQDRGLALAAAAYQGGLLLSQGAQRQAHFEHYSRRLDLCQQLGIPTLLVVADFATALEKTALERSIVSLKQAAQLAAAFGVRLGLEFHGRDTFCASLDTALSLIDQCNEPNVGVCLDVFHFYMGPSKEADLSLLNRDNLAHVQLSDLAGIPRELATDADRVLPGDGDFSLEPLLERIRTSGYDGWVSLELFNPQLWKAKPAQVAEVGLTALRRVLGLTTGKA